MLGPWIACTLKPQSPKTLSNRQEEERPSFKRFFLDVLSRTVPFVKAKAPIVSGVQLFFSISSLEFSSKAYSTAVLVDLQLDMLELHSTAAVANTFFSMYFHLAIVNFRGDEIIIVLPLRRLVYFHSKISYIFRWISWINITGAQSKSSKSSKYRCTTFFLNLVHVYAVAGYQPQKSFYQVHSVTECDRLTAV